MGNSETTRHSAKGHRSTLVHGAHAHQVCDHGALKLYISSCLCFLRCNLQFNVVTHLVRVRKGLCFGLR